jgi:hypothetical protein
VPVPPLPALQPRSATEIVDGAVQLVRPQYGYFLRIAALGSIPTLIQSVVMLVLFPQTSTDPGELLRQQLAMAPLTLVTLVFATLQSGAILVGGLAELRGDPLPSVWGAFRAALSRVLPLLGATFLLSLLAIIVVIPVIFVGALAVGFSAGGLQRIGTVGIVLAVVVSIAGLALMLVYGVSLFARISVVTALIVAETLGPIQAMSRAHALSRGSYVHLAKTYGLVSVMVGVVYLVLAGIAAGFREQQQLAQALISVLLIPVAPILGAVMLLTYADLRVRREGADLDAELEALALGVAR